MTQEINFADAAAQDRRHHLHPLTNPVALLKKGPDLVVRAEGVYLYSREGRKLLDAGAGAANVNIGYGNARLCEAASRVMRELSFSHSMAGRSNPWAAALAQKLAEITPEQFQQFFFASSGSEAIESAIKIALRYWRLKGKPGKRAIIARRGSYHGNTLFAASLTGVESFHPQFGLPISDLIHHADSPYWYRDGKGQTMEEFGLKVARELEEQILQIGPETLAAMVGDPVQTGTGLIIPPASYWPQVRQICDRHDILLIADEVISGFGKTGRMFGFENFGFEPDLMVVAKGISSGYFPISAVGVGRKVGEVIQSADETFAHVFTNCGHPVGAAVALENIAFIEEHGLVDRVREQIGPHLHGRLQELLKLPCVADVRSLGVLGAIEVDLSQEGRPASKAENDAFFDKVQASAWRRGVVTRSGVCLPMIITTEQIDEVISVLKDSIVEALSSQYSV